MDFTVTWRQFLDAPQTLGPSPGVRAQWHKGRARYAVWLCRLRSLALTERVAAIAAQLGDAIHPIPADDIHVTVYVAGFPAETPTHSDDISWETLVQQRGQLQRHFRPTVLEIGCASSFSTAAFLEVRDPSQVLCTVRDALGAATRELRFGPYQPHVTIGVYRDSRPTGPIIEALQQWRGLTPIPVSVDAVELVTFDAATQGSRLDTHWRVFRGSLAD